MFRNYRMIRGIAAGLVVLASPLDARPNPRGESVVVTAKLSEWKVQLSAATVSPCLVAFSVTNSGSIPHALEVEGQGLEQQTVLAPAGLKHHSHLDARARNLRGVLPGRRGFA